MIAIYVIAGILALAASFAAGYLVALFECLRQRIGSDPYAQPHGWEER